MSAVTYTIDQVCEMTGVSRRTVRYYVQQGLLEPPVGRGRGGNYIDRHVERLREIRSLQERGWTLANIEKYLDLPKELQPKHQIHEERVEEPEEGSASFHFPSGDVRRTVRTTFRIGPGVEIVVDRDAEEGMSRKIQEIVLVATTILSRKE